MLATRIPALRESPWASDCLLGTRERPRRLLGRQRIFGETPQYVVGSAAELPLEVVASSPAGAVALAKRWRTGAPAAIIRFMKNMAELAAKIAAAIKRDRLVETAVALIQIPSPTGNAGAVSNKLADLLNGEGFAIERNAAGHPKAPAVVARYNAPQPGKILQFNGHLDTVHLPFVPPAVHDGQITGSGAADMKGGLAAAIEALRVLRETGLLTAGGILLTAHDLHEAPWGLGQQLDLLIRRGCHGDAVLIPEPFTDPLPVIGRGSATWKVKFSRKGAAVHEVMRPPEEPSVIGAGSAMIQQLLALESRLKQTTDPVAGAASVFVGQIHAGEIYNQYPRECFLEGTRRWLPGTDPDKVREEFQAIVSEVALQNRVMADLEYRLVRDAFQLDTGAAIVHAFQSAHYAVSSRELELGAKPFVDDGNSFWSAGVPAITHGPQAGGQHTIAEWVSIDDLVRVATVYCLTAISFCSEEPSE